MKLYKLNIITPFKDSSLKKLKKTITPLCNQNYTNINHYIIYDNSCKNLLFSKYFPQNIENDFYSVRKICAKKSGIYAPINQGLEKLEKDEYYLVLGAGDILIIKNNIQINSLDNFILIPYCLSRDLNKVINSFFCSIMLGMPYCHNAMIFKKNDFFYDVFYDLASDYDYLIRYLFFLVKTKNKSIIYFEKNASKISDSALVIYDSEEGLSKDKRINTYKETSIIILKNFGFLKVLTFFIHLILKIFSKLKIEILKI